MDGNIYHFKDDIRKDTIYVYPVTRQEIKSIISLLKNRKALGFDNITPVLIKNVADGSLDILVYLVNFSLTSVPERFEKNYSCTVVQKDR